MTKIGIPQAGYYWKFFPFWKEFFSQLGFEVAVSPKTDKDIMQLGLRTANSEACLPIKLMYGHINWLRGNGINAILLPQMDGVKNSIEEIGGHSYFCPHFVAMPDMMKAEYPELEILRPVMSFTGNVVNPEPWIALGQSLGKTREQSEAAYAKAQGKHLSFLYKMKSEKLMACEVIDKSVMQKAGSGKPIALIGHSYIVNDDFANLRLVKKINDHGFSVMTREMFSNHDKAEAAKSVQWQPHNHWEVVNDQRLAVMAAAHDPEVAGIIYLTPFNCGPDFMMEGYCLRDARKLKPVTTISIDESSGEAGLGTRLEAFIDVLK